MSVGQEGLANTFLDPHDKLWSLYLAGADRRDKTRAEHWKGTTDGILIFTGLFATTVASFVVYMLPKLTPDTGDQTVVLLSNLLIALQNQTALQNNQTFLPPNQAAVAPLPGSLSNVTATDQDDGHPESTAAAINVFFILSLFLSICCALASILVQQWGRSYIHDSNVHAALGKRGLVHAGLESGIEKSMSGTIAVIVTVLHISVFLFFIGLTLLVWTTPHIHIKVILTTAMGLAALIYVWLSLVPLVSHVLPFHTPFSWIFTFFHVSFDRLLSSAGPGFDKTYNRHGRHDTGGMVEPRGLLGTFWKFMRDEKTWTVNKRTACLDESLHGVSSFRRVSWIEFAFSRLAESVDELEDAISIWEAFLPFIEITAGP